MTIDANDTQAKAVNDAEAKDAAAGPATASENVSKTSQRQKLGYLLPVAGVLGALVWYFGYSGSSSPCSDSGVLDTVMQLIAKQTLGGFADLPPNLVTLQRDEASTVRIDSSTGNAVCAVTMAVDVVEVAKLGGASNSDLDKLRVAIKNQKSPAKTEQRIGYTVQSLASGRKWITLMP